MTSIDRRDLVRGAFATSFLGVTAATVAGAPAAQAAPNDPIRRADVIERAWNWYNRNIQYNQGATATGPGGVYSWRTDCSGFVSMALKLGPTGINCPWTGSLATSTYSYGISRSNLRPGDYLVDAGNHVVLFHRWANTAHTQFVLFELGNTASDMNHRTAYLSSYGSAFLARRAHNIRD